MDKPLRVLIVEDSEDDALLVMRELERGGYDTTFERVETAEAMTAALEKQAWDIIIADYRLPHFSAPEALELFHQSGLDLPFIVISGTIGEETAVATMKAGAHDYLMKGNLTRLVPAVERELHEAEMRKERKQAEEVLRFSDAAFKSIQESVVAADTEYTITHWNEVSERIYGIKASEAIGKKLFDVIEIVATFPGETADRVKELESQGYYQDEVLHRTKYAEVWVSVSVQAIEDGGKRYGWVALATDITERKRAEERMWDSEARYHSIFDAATDVFLIFDLDGNIVEANPQACKMYGYSHDELIKLSGKDIVHSDYYHLFEQFKHDVQTTGGFYAESVDVRRDGTPFNIEVRGSELNYRDKRHLLAVVRDITERKQAEEELKLRALLLDSANDSINLADFDGNLLYVNETFCRSNGYSREELIGMNLHQLDIPQYAELIDSRYQEVREKGEATFESAHFHKDGSILPVEVHARVIESGGRKLILSVDRDITERKKMQEQLMVADRLASIGELASGIAHELNNPLTSIIGFSDLLLEKGVSDDIKEDLKIINREAQRTAGVVRNLLTFARKHETAKQPVDINNIIQKVLELRAYEQKVNNIEVNTQFAPDLPETTADGFQLQQVFINIIINTEHFMIEAHGRGTLNIITEQEGDIIRASFADDGPGIAEENLGYVFNPFFTTKEVGKGTGLGLSICHGIVTEHGGRIYVESEVGKGATFIVELPISG